jgi:thioredoxin reductase
MAKFLWLVSRHPISKSNSPRRARYRSAVVNVLQLWWPAMYDVLVVGGGPAGLSAALMLGRCRRRTLVCDEGRPRNRRSRALHGYLTRDGIDPADFNRCGREELSPYGIEFRAIGVADAARGDGHFDVTLGDGRIERSRFILIASGVADEVPRIPGLDVCYGRTVFHCPYCDGWEWRDQRIGVLGAGASGPKLALSLKTWSADVTLYTNGGRIGLERRQRLARNDVQVRTEKIVRLDHSDGELCSVVLEGDAVPCAALFFTGGQHPQCDLAVRLGCQFNQKGTVRTSHLSETNVPGVFVAGDASHDAQFVIVAAAEGVKAALAINQALQRAELAP